MTHNYQTRSKSLSRDGQAQQPRQEASQAPLTMADRKAPGPVHLGRCVVPMLHRGVEFSPGITNKTRIQRHRGIVLRHLAPSWSCHAYLLWKKPCPHCLCWLGLHLGCSYCTVKLVVALPVIPFTLASTLTL